MVNPLKIPVEGRDLLVFDQTSSRPSTILDAVKLIEIIKKAEIIFWYKSSGPGKLALPIAIVEKARKNQKIIEVKEIKFRPGTDTHDYEVKMRSVTKFLENGDKVKITLRFRGREMAHQELGRELLERVATDIDGFGKIENIPKMEGRQMTMMIGPNSSK